MAMWLATETCRNEATYEAPRRMAMSDRFTPRYFEIEQVLRARINELSSGDALPSDADLSRQFGVSRMTVRQAFQALVQEGLVERRPGTGTFVADKSARRQATCCLR